MKNSIHKVSVVITCHSYGKYLDECLQSLFKQTVPCEILVCDNGSTDETAEILSKYPTIRIVKNKERMEFKKIMNFLISKVNTEYVVMLGADDKLEPDFIKKCLKAGGDVIRTGLREFGAGEIVMNPPESPSEGILDHNTMYFSSMFKKSLWQAVGGLDENIPTYEDWDFWIRCVKKGAIVNTVKEPLFLYRIHPEQATKVECPDLHEKTIKYIKEKYS